MIVSAQEIIARCRRIAEFSDSPAGITRTFLSPAMHDVHRFLSEWMNSLGMRVSIDAMGNLRGLHNGNKASRRLIIASHLDTVPNAGAFDGILGVVLAIALIQSLDTEVPFDIEVIGFSEEEGVRFGVPFLGSRALVNRVDNQLLALRDPNGVSIAEAIRQFGLNPAQLDAAVLDPAAFACLEFHIEQGPTLEHLKQPLGTVQAVAGQSRYRVQFTGSANHAGTTPMHLRRDALAGAAEWISYVEAEANRTSGLVATVSATHSVPQAGNVIAGIVTASLDVRHAVDETRIRVADKILESGRQVAANRNLQFLFEQRLDQPAVVMNSELVAAAQRAALRAGCNAQLMISGAGHDAMIIAEKIPSVMIFLRSPGGISHHPDESVLPNDVDLALQTGLHFIRDVASQ